MQRDTVTRFVDDQRDESRRRRNDCVSKATGHDEPGAVASALWKRLTAGCEHNRPGMKTAGGGRQVEAVGAGNDVEDPFGGQQRDAHAIGFSKQRVEHVARPVAVGKKLAAGLFVNVDTELREKGDRLVHGKSPQHATDDRRSPAPEIALGDDGVGHVAAGTAADKNLGARLPCAFDQHDGSRRILSSREDGGREAGRAGADNRDIAWKGRLRQRRKLIAKAAGANLTPGLPLA